MASITLTECDITYLPPGCFDDFTALQILHLGNNKLKSFPKSVFDKCVGLTFLNIGLNPVTELDVTVFSKLVKLKTLQIQNFGLSSVPPGLFVTNTSLTELYMGGWHSLRVIFPPTLFNKLKCLATLSIDKVPL